eukprot:scaffold1004_cov269-Pinguiococcus_pyrenoidosus.AAC.11
MLPPCSKRSHRTSAAPCTPEYSGKGARVLAFDIMCKSSSVISAGLSLIFLLSSPSVWRFSRSRRLPVLDAEVRTCSAASATVAFVSPSSPAARSAETCTGAAARLSEGSSSVSMPPMLSLLAMRGPSSWPKTSTAMAGSTVLASPSSAFSRRKDCCRSSAETAAATCSTIFTARA